MTEHDGEAANDAKAKAMRERTDDALIAPFMSYSVRLHDLADCLRLMTEERAKAALARAQADRSEGWEPLPSYKALMRLAPRALRDMPPEGPVF